MNQHISGGGEASRERIQRLLQTGRINGVDVHIEVGYQPRWGEPNSAGYYGIPDGNKKFAVCKAGIDVDDWLDLQYSISGAQSMSRFLDAAYDETVEGVEKRAQNGTLNAVPEPVLNISYEGYEAVRQEGRSRGLAARKAGLDMIPIWIAAQEYR